MAKLTLVSGLPGSGKSTFIESNVYDAVFDDFFATQPQDESAKVLDDNKDPLKNARFIELIDALGAGKHVVVSDILFCIPFHRNVFISLVLKKLPQIDLEYIFFENNSQLAKKNVRNRARKDRVDKELQLIDEISARYSKVEYKEERIYES